MPKAELTVDEPFCSLLDVSSHLMSLVGLLVEPDRTSAAQVLAAMA